MHLHPLPLGAWKDPVVRAEEVPVAEVRVAEVRVA